MAPIFDVLGVGAACVDIVSLLPAFPEPHGPRSKLRVADRTERCGGQTATAMVACARLGLRAAYAGAVGDDAHGARVTHCLADNGVDLAHLVVRPDTPTATAQILVPEPSRERVVLWNRHPDLALTTREQSSLPLAEAAIVHVDDVDITVAVAVAERARAAGAVVTSDIDGVGPGTADLLDRVSYIILADHVPLALTGEPDCRRAARLLWQRHRTPVCVTLGAAGALLCDDGALAEAPGFDVRVADTTGAGDVFRAGFIYGLRQGWAGPRLLQFANAVAAASCMKLGAIDGAPTLDQVETLMADR